MNGLDWDIISFCGRLEGGGGVLVVPRTVEARSWRPVRAQHNRGGRRMFYCMSVLPVCPLIQTLSSGKGMVGCR